MNNRTKIFVLTVIIGLLLIYITYSKIDFQEVVNSFKKFEPRIFILYFSAIALIEIFLVIRWFLIVKSFNIKLPFHSLFLYKMSGYAIGYLSPQAHVGGEPVRALLMKRQNVEFKKGISTVVIDKSMQLTTDLLFAFTGFSLLVLHFSISRKIEIVIYGFILGAIILLAYYFYCMVKEKPFFSAILNLKFLKKFKKITNIRKDIQEVEHTIHTFYVKHFKYFISVIIVNFILYCLMIIEYGAAIALFGFTPTFYTVFIIMGGVALSYSLPVPMALGVLELSQVTALGILSLNTAIGLSISLLVRTKDVLRTLIGGTSLFYFGMSWRYVIKEIQDTK